MNAKRLFEDDDILFPANDLEEGSDDRVSHVELIDFDPPSTQRETPIAENYLLRVPMLGVREEDLALLPLDHREGFVIAQIDGLSSIESILDVCPMPSDEALMILADLVERRIVILR